MEMTDKGGEAKLSGSEVAKEAMDGGGEAKPGDRVEVEGRGSAAPGPRDRDKDSMQRIEKVVEEPSSERKKMKPGGNEEDEGGGEDEEGSWRSKCGSGGHEPGGYLEMTTGQISELGTRGEGLGECRSFGGFEGEEKKDVPRNKIDGAGGVKPGREGEEDQGIA